MQETVAKTKNDWVEIVPVRGMRRMAGPGMAKVIKSGKRYLLNLHNDDLGPAESASVFVKGQLIGVVPGGPFRVSRDPYNPTRCHVNISQVMKLKGWTPKRGARMRAIQASVNGKDGVVVDMDGAINELAWEA